MHRIKIVLIKNDKKHRIQTFKTQLPNSMRFIQNMFFFKLGLQWVRRPIKQGLLSSLKTIPLWFLESVGSTISCVTDCGIMRASLIYWWNIYNRQAYIRPFFACDVSEVLGSVPDFPTDRTYYYFDKRNGIF